MQIVNALRFDERSRASSLLSDIGHRNIALTANDFVYILEYCARSTDPLVDLRMIICFPMAIMQPMVSVFEICRVLEYEILLAHALISTLFKSLDYISVLPHFQLKLRSPALSILKQSSHGH